MAAEQPGQSCIGRTAARPQTEHRIERLTQTHREHVDGAYPATTSIDIWYSEPLPGSWSVRLLRTLVAIVDIAMSLGLVTLAPLGVVVVLVHGGVRRPAAPWPRGTPMGRLWLALEPTRAKLCLD